MFSAAFSHIYQYLRVIVLRLSIAVVKKVVIKFFSVLLKFRKLLLINSMGL